PTLFRSNANTKSWRSGGPTSTARLRGSRSTLSISFLICATSRTSIAPLGSPSLEPFTRVERREPEEAGAEAEHRPDRPRELGPHVARQEERLQPRDVVPRRDDPREPLDRLRHAVDLEQKPRQQKRRQEAGEERKLRRDELVLRRRRDQETEPERRHQERRGQREERRHRALERHAEPRLGRDRADERRAEPETEVRQELPDQELADADRRRHHRF